MFCVRPVIVHVSDAFFFELIFYLVIIWRIEWGDKRGCVCVFVFLFFSGSLSGTRLQPQSVHMWLELDERTRAADGTLSETYKSSCRGWGGREGVGIRKKSLRLRNVIWGAAWKKKQSYLSRKPFLLLK